MKQIILISHGNAANEILNSCKMICGEIKNYYALSFLSNESPQDLEMKIKKLLNNNIETIIIVDFKGGTPYNVAAKFKNEKIFLLTGLNIPMLIETFFMIDNLNITDLKDKMMESGKNSIIEYNIEEKKDDEF